MAAKKHTPSIAIITAVPLEAGLILKAMGHSRIPSGPTVSGSIGTTGAVLMCPGPGIANAAHAATVLVERHAPSMIIITGIGGAFHGTGLRHGDVVAAKSETYAELGSMTPEGFLSATQIGLHTLTRGCREYFESFSMDKGLLKAARPHVKATGGFITVSTVTGTTEAADKLSKRFPGVLCENMEGAAVAQVGKRYGLPVLEIRGISNMVEDRDTGKWKIRPAAQNAQEAVLEIIRSLATEA